MLVQLADSVDEPFLYLYLQTS